ELTQVAEALRFRSAGGFGADLLHRAGEAFAAGTERLHDSAADRLRAPRELPVCEERLGSLGEGEWCRASCRALPVRHGRAPLTRVAGCHSARSARHRTVFDRSADAPQP